MSDNNNLPGGTQMVKSSIGFFDILEKMKNYFSFFLTLICILGSLALAWFKGISLEVLLPSLLGIYVLGRTGQKGMAYFAASKDETADTRAVIQDLDGIKPPKIQD
jgi:hypothetical protein